ncbi:MAG: hypothetical protein IT219_09510, partial [Bacteroidales bacterium]|nr:hypothetical protein [Bacteroidales bacterium]
MKNIYFSNLNTPRSTLSFRQKTIGTMLFLLFLLALNPLVLEAQYAVPTTGGNISSAGGKISLTIGQPVYSFHTGAAGNEAQGVQQPFCSNPTSGGTIGNNQDICSGGTPLLLENLTMPDGYVMPLEFKWVASTTDAVSGFSDVANSNSAGYQPGALTQTTWFKRLSRVNCKADWSDATPSNVVKVTVEPTPVAGTLTKTPN